MDYLDLKFPLIFLLFLIADFRWKFLYTVSYTHIFKNSKKMSCQKQIFREIEILIISTKNISTSTLMEYE